MTALATIETASRYHPLTPIGRGGMAEVLLTLMDAGVGARKVVVLKRIWPDLATDPAFVTMFRDEARLAMHLNHPNVVQTHEVVDDAEQLAIAMEYLHGQSLTAVMGCLRGPRELSLPLRLRILVDVLAALHYAHELTDYGGASLGVVHRDVSPHNVFVTYDGQIKLMDFGVAKSIAAAHQTRPGAIIGKLPYLAPEYLRSNVVDRRADIFSAGVMLWELLAGRRLWHGMAEAEIVYALAIGKPAPALPADFSRPPVLDGICARALATNPDERYATAAELELDLQQVLAGAADSHARTLGRVVSHAFATARAEREALIGHALATGQLAEKPTVGTKTPRWTKEIEVFLSAPDEMLEVTVVDPPIELEPLAREPLARQPAAMVSALLAPPVRRRPRTAGVMTGAIGVAALLGLVLASAPRGAPVPPASPPQPTVTPARAGIPVPPDDPPAAAVSPPAPSLCPAPEPQPPADWEQPHLVRSKGTARRARDAAAARRDDQRRVESSPFEELDLKRLRPASRRTIDESDPFQ